VHDWRVIQSEQLVRRPKQPDGDYSSTWETFSVTPFHSHQCAALNSGRDITAENWRCIETIYWLFLAAIYFYIPFGDPGYEYGGLRLILYTLPWGFVGQRPAAIGAIAPVRKA